MMVLRCRSVTVDDMLIYVGDAVNVLPHFVLLDQTRTKPE